MVCKMRRKKRRDPGLIPEHAYYFFKCGPDFLYKQPNWAELGYSVDFFLMHGRWIKQPWEIRKEWSALKPGPLAGIDISGWWFSKHGE
jgi:hypothetical protein